MDPEIADFTENGKNLKAKSSSRFVLFACIRGQVSGEAD
jgi:hypothetical protein